LGCAPVKASVGAERELEGRVKELPSGREKAILMGGGPQSNGPTHHEDREVVDGPGCELPSEISRDTGIRPALESTGKVNRKLGDKACHGYHDHKKEWQRH